ncbi:M20/M25/M40 family metallo-hydrolase [Pseudonocardia sp. DSM 110487]|uniref:M20/M25/M40 family metallo-hydrolase n=1 Tax=Pseudonocardia sp. DSM 110487 TaxID=2865833 RepID=UPI001C69804E|nr:M20/M25/M40 family metallo-hydrolase [Pseudonocardia sp. DSM 110487]QYN37915.1 M20/M25/M40 family metallo-hydrolase [Pseudonocardia sp. DSM 110487]
MSDFSGAAAALADDAVGRLIAYARHETPTGDAPALNALADVLEERYRELGARIERVAQGTGDHLVARWGDADAPHVLLLGHHDTVWPTGTLESMPLTEADGVLRGPGVYDMKGGLVVAELAFEVLRRCDAAPARPVRLVVVADEEVGSPTARPLVEAHMAGAVAVLGLESPHPGGALKTARLGSTRVRIEIAGRAAHAALDPESGVSAVDELVDQLLAVREIMASEPTVLCNVGTVDGGGRTNVVPDRAAADIGLRFTDVATQQRVLGALGRLTPVRPGAEVVVRTLTSRPAWSDPADDLLARVAMAGTAVGQEIAGRPAAGGADTNIAGAAGIPTLDGFGPLGGGAHAPDERIETATLPARAALLAAILTTL